MRWIGALLLSLCLACAAHAQVSFDAKSEAHQTSTTSPLTFSGHTIGAISNPAIVCVWTVSPATTLSAVSATWNGTTMTAIGNAQWSASASTFIFGLAPVTTGNHNFVVSFTGSLSTAGEGGYTGCISFSGANQTGGATTFKNFNSVNPMTSTNTTVSLSVTTTTGDATVVAGITGQTPTETTGTSWFNDSAESSATGLNGIGSYILTASGTSNTHTWTQTADIEQLVGVDIAAAAGGGPTCPMTRATLGVGC